MKLISDLTRATVTPLPKNPRQRTTCNRPLCSEANQCAACRGRANQRKGRRQQDTVRKRLRINAAYRGLLGNEEKWGGPFRTEVKAGAQAEPVLTRYLLAENQSNQNKAIGDPRPFRAVFMPEEDSDGVVCVRLSVWARDIEPLIGAP